MSKLETVKKVMYTETAHRLMHHGGKCSKIHGHSYRWEVELKASLEGKTERGMFLDFSDLKRVMNNCIGSLDHVLILNTDDHLIDNLCKSDGVKLMLVSGDPTAENMARYAAECMAPELVTLVGEFKSLTVTVWETRDSSASYTFKY